MKFIYLLIRLLLLILIFNAPTFAVRTLHCCKNCTYTSPKKSNMDVHIRTHTGEKPFICTVENCGKRFSKKGNLKQHIRTHTGEKPFICTVENCGIGFATNDILKVHIRTHTGEKPHTCPTCGKNFADRSSFKRHQKMHQGAEGGAINQIAGVEAPVARVASPDPRLAVGDMPGTSGIARPARPETRNILDGFLDYERDSERDMTTPAPQVFKSYLPEYE